MLTERLPQCRLPTLLWQDHQPIFDGRASASRICLSTMEAPRNFNDSETPAHEMGMLLPACVTSTPNLGSRPFRGRRLSLRKRSFSPYPRYTLGQLAHFGDQIPAAPG